MKRLAIPAAGVVVVLLAAYGLITFYDTNQKYGRMWETPAVRPHEAPLLPMAAGVVPFYGGEAGLRLGAEETLAGPFAPGDPVAVQAGGQLYLLFCVHCHGKYHDGNATVGQSFAPLPTDIRSSRVQSLPPGRLFKEISYGVAGGRQPPLATTISVDDRWRIVSYIQSLGIRE